MTVPPVAPQPFVLKNVFLHPFTAMSASEKKHMIISSIVAAVLFPIVGGLIVFFGWSLQHQWEICQTPTTTSKKATSVFPKPATSSHKKPASGLATKPEEESALAGPAPSEVKPKPEKLPHSLLTKNGTDLHQLEAEIQYLKLKHPVLYKKALLLEQGLERLLSSGAPLKLQTYSLASTEPYSISPDKDPEYFQKKLSIDPSYSWNVTNQFYNYEATPGGNDVWVDFANQFLGGGCFGHGFVQEEIMVHEMPEFAAHIATNSSKGRCNILTRDDSTGTPNPYLLTDVLRVQAVDNNAAYGRKIETIDQADLLSSTKPLLPPQRANILAIAAPDLPSATCALQCSYQVLADIFNTLAAGFTLAKETMPGKPCVVHSGRLGCGVFNNDPRAVYLLHLLAAQFTGVQLKLHGFKASEAAAYNADFQKLAPQLQGKSIHECLDTLSQYLIATPAGGKEE